MTDGIIQEVFKRYWKIEIPTTTKLEQELIEKIKQSIEYHEGCYHIQRGCSLKTDLIGDNQE